VISITMLPWIPEGQPLEYSFKAAYVGGLYLHVQQAAILCHERGRRVFAWTS